MKKSDAIILIATVATCCFAVLITAFIITSRLKDKSDNDRFAEALEDEETPAEDPTSSEPEDEDAEEEKEYVIAGEDRTLGQIIDERASGIDEDTTPIYVPRSDLSQYDDSVMQRTYKTVEEAKDDLVISFELMEYWDGFAFSEKMNYYGSMFDIVDNKMDVMFTFVDLLSAADIKSDWAMVYCPTPYEFADEDWSWLIGHEGKVYTVVLKGDVLYLFDQGIPYDENVREV